MENKKSAGSGYRPGRTCFFGLSSRTTTSFYAPCHPTYVYVWMDPISASDLYFSFIHAVENTQLERPGEHCCFTKTSTPARMVLMLDWTWQWPCECMLRWKKQKSNHQRTATLMPMIFYIASSFHQMILGMLRWNSKRKMVIGVNTI